MSGADGDESREDKNERLLNDKFVDLFEEYNLSFLRRYRFQLNFIMERLDYLL